MQIIYKLDVFSQTVNALGLFKRNYAMKTGPIIVSLIHITAINYCLVVYSYEQLNVIAVYM